MFYFIINVCNGIVCPQSMESINQDMLEVKKNLTNLIEVAGPLESQLSALLQSLPKPKLNLPMETDWITIVYNVGTRLPSILHEHNLWEDSLYLTLNINKFGLFIPSVALQNTSCCMNLTYFFALTTFIQIRWCFQMY